MITSRKEYEVNMKRKLLGFITCICLSLSLCTGTITNVEAGAGLSFAKTALWYILKKASTAYYSRSPSIEVGDNYVSSSTGSIYFNQGDTGAAAKVSVSLPWSRMAVDVHVTSDALNWLDKISIILTTPDGKKDVINKSIGRGQLASYDSASPYGTYQLRFVENDASKWTCYYTLYDFNYVPKSGVKKAVTSEGNMVKYIVTKDNSKIYTIRSNYQSNILKSFNDNDKNKVLNITELSGQFFDERAQTYVNDLKDYDIGDMIYFQDIIKTIKYNESDNSTSFIFSNKDYSTEWKFNGDLTNLYHDNGTIRLKFKVVEEYSSNGYIFENIDYIYNGINLESGYPNINDYLW